MSTSVYAGIVASIANTGERRYGLDPARLMAAGGLKQEDLRYPTTPIPIRAAELVLRAALTSSRDEGFGLRWAEEVDLRMQGCLGYALLSATTLQEWVDRNIRYLPLVGPISITLIREGDVARFDVSMYDLSVDLIPVVTDMYRASSFLYLKRVLPRSPRGFLMWMKQRERPHHAELRAMAPGPVQFGTDWDRTQCLACDLLLPNQAGDPHLGDLMTAQLDAEIGKLRSNTPLIENVRRRVGARLHADASIERIAEDLCLSVRTLQRALDAQGASFQELTAQVRQERAIGYLKDTEEPVDRIASWLGYGDASAFRRAFRRWAGVTPGVFRASHRAPNGRAHPDEAAIYMHP